MSMETRFTDGDQKDHPTQKTQTKVEALEGGQQSAHNIHGTRI
jgi:hypothetical protein